MSQMRHKSPFSPDSPTAPLEPEDQAAGALSLSFDLSLTREEPDDLLSVCPNCGRRDTLIVLGDFTACAACGYSSAGLRGCT